jgi:hypothetical protein
MSQVLRVAAAGRGTDIDWSTDPSRELRLSDIEALLAIPEDATFIAAAYEVVLGRRADPGGSTFHADALAADMDRGEFLLDLAESPEGRVRKGADEVRALLRAHRLGAFLGASGSVIDRAHLGASGRIDQVWPLLWVDAVRDVIPRALASDEEVDAFVAAISAGQPAADAVATAWKASLTRASIQVRIAGRIRLRLAWHSTWGRVHARFRDNVVFFAAARQLLDMPAERP